MLTFSFKGLSIVIPSKIIYHKFIVHQVIALAKEGVQEFYTGNQGNFDAVGIHAVAEVKRNFLISKYIGLRLIILKYRIGKSINTR